MSSTAVSEPTSSTRRPGAAAPGLRAVRWSLAKIKRFDLLGVLGVVAIFVAWWLVTDLQLVDPLYLPSLADVWDFAQANFFSSPFITAQNLGDGGLWESVQYSTIGVWLSVLIAVAIGLPLGLLSSRAVKVRMFSDPLLMTISVIPILVLAPFFMIWFGPNRLTQVLMLIVFCTPIIYIYAQRAVNNLGTVYEQNARIFGASRERIIRDIYLRGTLPEVLGGMRIALAGSWGLGAIAELMGAPKGVGKLILSFAANTNVVAIWATVLSFAVVAVLTDLALVLLMRFLNRWMP
jgi:ABC-type nitrate/sulfonate/bicarbonate transport system permease component